MNMQIYTPKFFTLAEFTKSTTAIKLGINNTPTWQAIENLRLLCQLVLDETREKYNAPIIIASGFRTAELNRAVGGVVNSKHLTGCAADMPYNSHLFDLLAANNNVDLLLHEYKGNANWIHVQISSTGTPRNKVIDGYKAK